MCSKTSRRWSRRSGPDPGGAPTGEREALIDDFDLWRPSIGIGRLDGGLRTARNRTGWSTKRFASWTTAENGIGTRRNGRAAHTRRARQISSDGHCRAHPAGMFS
jgi:hypothetical protein